MIENFPHSPYRILTPTRNTRSNYNSESLPGKQIPAKSALAGMRVFNNVEHGGQTNATFLFTLKNKRMLDDVEDDV